ncbi:MAG: DUF3109 family protein [Candidatus Cyclobacteriaceae bacterium M3_2C_046]
MIIIKDTIISEDVRESHFVCDLNKCKGACCVEGDLGAPLEKKELKIIKRHLEQIKPFLSSEGRREIDRQGPYIYDEDHEYSTPTIEGKECAYAIYDDQGILKCGIEEAFNEGKIDFRKPISCHLYPVRLTKYNQFTAVNYDRWEICSPACTLGRSLQVPLYVFLKDALVRKFGKSWYRELLEKVKEKELEEESNRYRED